MSFFDDEREEKLAWKMRKIANKVKEENFPQELYDIFISGIEDYANAGYTSRRWELDFSNNLTTPQQYANFLEDWPPVKEKLEKDGFKIYTNLGVNQPLIKKHIDIFW